MPYMAMALFVVVAVSLFEVEGAAAALDGGAQYEGSSTVGGQVRITVSSDRLTADVTFD